MLTTLRQDLKIARRNFGRSPGFVAAAILSLAIGIGANTSIFSVTNALLLRPLPFPDSDRLVILWNRSPGLNITQDWFSTAQYFDIKRNHTGFEQVAIAIGGNENLTGDGPPARIGLVKLSSNLLPMLGARTVLGRLFTPDEDSPGQPATALLTYGTWARRYGRNPNILGQTLRVNGKALIVVGVLAQDFSIQHEVLPTLGGPDLAEIVVPLPLAAGAADDRDHEDYNIVARLKRGVSVQQAQAEMDTLTARLREQHPDVYPPNGGLTFGIFPLLEQVVGDVRRPLLILNGAVAFVLLIACANVASLLLSRAVARQKEMAVRAALGASRRRIIQQLLTESVLLAVSAAGVGVVLSFSAVSALHYLGTRSVPRLASISVDARVLFFTLFVSFFAGILFGLAPALRVSRLDLHDQLTDSARGMSGANAVWGSGNHLRRVIVVAELALSLMLLVGAGLLIRSFARLQDVAPGFNPHKVLTFGITLRGQNYTSKEIAFNTYRELWNRFEHIPGVSAAGGVTALPLSEHWSWGPINVEGRIPLAGENFINADERVVAGHYFEAMQIPLIHGRLFDPTIDRLDKPPVILVDEFMANELWPGQDPVGKRIRNGGLHSTDPWMTVIGVVGRVKQYTLDSDGRIAFYLSHTQFPVRELFTVLRSDGAPVSLANSTREAVRATDPDLPLYDIRTMDDRVSESLARRRFSMVLLVVFAAFSLILASIGIHGLMSYLVTRGTHEIGIRMALGATQQKILAMVVARGMALAVTGVAIGLFASFLLTRVLESQLYGVSATDPLTFIAIPSILLLVALAAVVIPAWRASRTDPMLCLRSE
ncbi:MAG TPA: ABC transporter permease [Candidatus Saccharimonadales bacterium]|nr:ABC transporter permease [Candidatus Saccharimonadales bacterium]